MGVFGRLFLKAPTFSWGRRTWNEQLRPLSMFIMAPLLLNSPQ